MSSFLTIKVDYDSRIFGLDLLRAIAIINVVIVHANWMHIFPGYPWIPIIPGVELFFVLSGFLIGTVLLKTYLNSDDFGFRQLANFWKRRWFRTLPNYYLVLILNIIIVYFGLIKEDFSQFNWTFFVFSQNLFDGFYGFFWESWSLSIEEWFYLSFPIILLVLHSVLNRFGVKKKYIFLINTLLFLLFTILMRLLIGTRLPISGKFEYDTSIHKVVIYHLDGIALGLLAAYLRQWFPKQWFKSRIVAFVIGLAICLSMIYINWSSTSDFTIVCKPLLQSTGAFLLLPMFETLRTAPMKLRKIVTHISLISYSMYLINLCLVSSVITSNVNIGNELQAVAWYLVYWIVVIVLSTIMYKYYEKPLMDLRDRV